MDLIFLLKNQETSSGMKWDLKLDVFNVKGNMQLWRATMGDKIACDGRNDSRAADIG